MAEQLARPEAMLAALTGPALRWWQALPEALVLGRGQPLAAVDLEACRATGVRVFRRSTGGTAVLCGPQVLNLNVVLPAGHPLALADVTRSYRWLGEALVAGLGLSASRLRRLHPMLPARRPHRSRRIQRSGLPATRFPPRTK